MYLHTLSWVYIINAASRRVRLQSAESHLIKYLLMTVALIQIYFSGVKHARLIESLKVLLRYQTSSSDDS